MKLLSFFMTHIRSMAEKNEARTTTTTTMIRFLTRCETPNPSCPAPGRRWIEDDGRTGEVLYVYC